MLDALQRSFQNLVAPALIERATLLANHVIASEPAARERLMPHRGRRIVVRIDAVAGWLPPPPPLAFEVTPAGLLEWHADADAPAELVLRVDASPSANLASRLLSGQQPPVTIEGDAALAADVGWLVANLRWDLAADLERFLPPAVVHQLVAVGMSLRSGLVAVMSSMRRPE